MTIEPIKTRVFQENENLERFIFQYIPAVQEHSIVIITSKIIALAQGRTHPDVSDAAKERLVKEESEWEMKTELAWLALKDDMLAASAGIDASNANGKLVLLPKKPFDIAKNLQENLCKRYGISTFGILITDSRGLPLRAGTVGYAIGYAGFRGLRDNRGMPDIFGRILQFERSNISDSLASSAVLCMGEAAEQTPLAVITNPPVEWTHNPSDPNELVIQPEDDMYRPFFQKYKK